MFRVGRALGPEVRELRRGTPEMVLFNYSTRELTAKIVYYGPGLCGKTTNLQYIHANLPDGVKGRMLSLATKTDRTLFFDFLPIDLGEIRGMKTRVQLYTTPGQVFYNETRKLVLKGADGIVFVADSQEQMVGANVESFRNLEENLRGHGMRLQDMPHVIQFNKRDLPNLASIEEVNSAINRYNAPFYESVATTGIGVQDTLKAVVKLVLLHLTRKYETKSDPRVTSAGADRAPRPAPPLAAAPQRVPAAEAERPIMPTRVPSDAQWPAAEKMQPIPVSRFETPLSRPAVIRLSDAPETTGVEARQSSAPPPPDFRGSPGAGSTAEANGLSFDADEIDGLVGEVEELGENPLASDDIDWMPPRHEPVEAAEVPEEVPVEAVEEEVPVEAPAQELAAAGPAEIPVPREPRFEVDLGFDPSWQPGGLEEIEEVEDAGEPSDFVLEPLETSLESEVVEEPEVRDEPVETPLEATPIPVHHAEETPAAFEDGAVVLEEVAGNEELFEDPGLEVARLRAGESREILVPVEIVEGGAVRRFKLSLRLRLDPLD
jgi:signal recognition particle receptor subunit beta